MDEIEKQALALVTQLQEEDDGKKYSYAYHFEALCRALKMLNAEREAHAAYRQEVSDAVEEVIDRIASPLKLRRFIIKPPVDPVRLILESVCFNVEDRDVEKAKATLAARGGRIVFDGGE